MILNNCFKVKQSQWELSNPILKVNEIGIALDDNDIIVDIKIGNGKTPWNDLDSNIGEIDDALLKKYQEELDECHNLIQKENDDFYLPEEGES